MDEYNAKPLQEIAERLHDLIRSNLSQAEHIGEIEHEIRNALQMIGV